MSSRLFLPSATNYFPNPNLALDTNADGMSDGWANDNVANITVTNTRVTRVIEGQTVTAQKVRMVGLAGCPTPPIPLCAAASTAVGSFVQNDQSTLSCYLKITEISGCSIHFYVHGRDAADGWLDELSTPVLTSTDADFVRRSYTKTWANASMSRLLVMLQVPGDFHAGDVVEFEMAMMQLEKSSILTPYFDGSYPNCAWTGAANASTSTRTVSALVLPCINSGMSGTIAHRFSPLWSDSQAGTERLIYLMNASSLCASQIFTTRVCVASVWDGVPHSAWRSTAVQTFAAGSVHSVTSRWTRGATLDLNFDGTNVAQGSATTIEAAASNLVSMNFTPGSARYVGPVIISPFRKTDSWTTAIQASSGAAYSSPSGIWNTYMESGDLFIPLSSNGKAYMKLDALTLTSNLPAGGILDPTVTLASGYTARSNIWTVTHPNAVVETFATSGFSTTVQGNGTTTISLHPKICRYVTALDASNDGLTGTFSQASIRKMPNLTNLQLQGNPALDCSFAISDLTSKVTYLNASGTVSTVSGAVSNISRGATYVNLYSTSANVTGYVSQFPSGSTYINLGSTVSSVSGNLANLPTGITYIDLQSATGSSVSGNISSLPSGMTYLNLSNTNSVIAGGSSGMVASGITDILLSNCPCSTVTYIDDVLLRLYTDRATFTGGTCTVDLTGTTPEVSFWTWDYINSLVNDPLSDHTKVFEITYNGIQLADMQVIAPTTDTGWNTYA